MEATHFLTKTPPKIASEMAPHVRAYKLTKLMNILGAQPLMLGDAAIAGPVFAARTGQSGFQREAFLHDQSHSWH
jgi:hypothetical protein